MFSKKATKIEGEDFIKFWGLLRKNMNFSKCIQKQLKIYQKFYTVFN